MPKPKPTKSGTYAELDDLKTLIPNITDYIFKAFKDEREQKIYTEKCLKLANDWVNNELEAGELHTYAKTNNRKLAEANYAVYLILRGTVRGKGGERNDWIDDFKEDAENELKKIEKRAAAAPGHSSRTERFTKKRSLLKDYVRSNYYRKI